MRLIQDLLAFLYLEGWEVVGEMMCSSQKRDKDTIILHSAGPGYGIEGERDADWLVLMPNGRDKLRIIYN